MSYPHAIRLRGPWEIEPLVRYLGEQNGGWSESTEQLPPKGRVKPPGDWGESLGADFRGRARYTRRFRQPSGLETRERVWLVIEGVDASGCVQLNGQRLGDVHGYALRASFDVTERLQPQNELVIDVDLPPELGDSENRSRPGRARKPGGLIREVRLEIRREISIERLAIWVSHEEPRLHASAEVMGHASSTLNLFVKGLRREIYFGEVQPGKKFEISADIADLPKWSSGSPGSLEPIEVQLLHGGETLWQTARPTAFRPMEWDGTSRLAVGEGEDSLPLLPASATEAAKILVPDTPFFAAEILPDQSYDRFDALAIPLVQSVPVAWAGEVCPRLAHHPSIIAWSATKMEAANASIGEQGDSFVGRPWLR